MKKILFTFPLALLVASAVGQIYMAKTCEISFFSESPLENIDAVNKVTKPIMNTSTNDIQMKIPVKGFVFSKPLMEEHFNEDYMESDKFPDAFFRGKINETIDYTKEGENKVTATGKITMHGVDKEKTIEGTLTVKNGQIIIQSKFLIHIADYNIKVPSLYVKNIAEDVTVNLNATLEKYNPPPAVKVGMTKEEVIKILGQPEKTSQTATKEGTKEMLFYDTGKTSVNIGVDGKVDYINKNK